MKRRVYKGYYPDITFDCVAKDEAEAQRILKKQLLAEIEADDEPLIVWLDHEEESTE